MEEGDVSMIERKTCVLLNGVIIHIGDWEGKMQLPEGAVIEERDFKYSDKYGWREVGWTPEPTQDDYLLDLDYRVSLLELGL